MRRYPFVVLLLGFVAVSPGLGLAPEAKLSSRSVYRETARFVNDAGVEVRLSDFRGRPIVLTMFYTDCTSRCPLTLRWLREIDAAFREHGTPIEFVLVSFDSRNDTPKQLARYRKREKLPTDRWHLLTGGSVEVESLAERIAFSRYQDMGEHIVHGSRIVLLDPQGAVLESTDWGNRNLDAWLAHDLTAAGDE